ncbi:MAG TPA: hypothetical protein VNF73_16975, partial [Candidatus Saccharimonadales bacterium]|nr:hypothetical protein [Candidatus Saccharimonadales bacterium]
MASSPTALDEEKVAELASDVQCIHHHGAVAWGRDGGPISLSAIQGLSQVRQMVAAGKAEHEAVWDAARQACEALLSKWINPGLAYLGYEYKKPKRGLEGVSAAGPEKSPTARERAAAQLIPIDARTFRAEITKPTRTYGQQGFH